MKKAYIVLTMFIFLIVNAGAGYSIIKPEIEKKTGGRLFIEIGSQSLFISFTDFRGKLSKFKGGLGIAAWFTGESIPEYIPTEGEPYDWWIYQGEYKKGNAWELFLRGESVLTKRIMLDYGIGYAVQDIVNLYKSTATGWYFGYEDSEGSVCFLLGTTIRISDKLDLSIGYHSPRGITGGLVFRI